MKFKPQITTALRVDSINNRYVSTKSVFHKHSSLIFKHLNIVNLPNLVQIFLNIKVFVYKFHNRRLPSVFDTFFTQVNKRHNYNTRSASNMLYTLPKVWNSTCENLKTFCILNLKKSVKSDLVRDFSYLYSYQQLCHFPNYL